MAKTIEATYENGVFKPKEPVELEDNVGSSSDRRE